MIPSPRLTRQIEEWAANPDAAMVSVRLGDLRELHDLAQAIHALRADEGDSVQIHCDNPEGPPNNAVECCGFWTDWTDRRFTGETLIAALQAALAARSQA